MSFKYIIRRVAKFLRISMLIVLFLFLVMLYVTGKLNPIITTILKWSYNVALPYLLSIPEDISPIISTMGIFATVTVTFLTLLFAIAAINASFQTGMYNTIDSGAYPLKMLIKVDLQSTAKKTLIPQLSFIVIAFILQNVIPIVFWMVIVLILFILMVYTLWTATNSVYYSIIQYTSDPSLDAELQEMKYTCSSSRVINYCSKPYDVYSVKKTLFPKIYKKTYNNLRMYNPSSFSKREIVYYWNDRFKTTLQSLVFEITNSGKYTLLDALKSKDTRKKNGKLLNRLKPKIQAPDKITKICLDFMYNDLIFDDGLSDYHPSKNTLEICFLLLYSHREYVESRQDERSKHNVKINRRCYTNPADTHMYMMYGYISYLLGNYEIICEKYDCVIKYYNAAIDAYRCAMIVNPKNNVAEQNIDNIVIRKKILMNKHPELRP